VILVIHGLHVGELVQELNDARRLPLTAGSGSSASWSSDGLLAVLVLQDVGLSQIVTVLQGAAGRANQLARVLTVVVTAKTAANIKRNAG
jgi:hypothetical protein